MYNEIIDVMNTYWDTHDGKKNDIPGLDSFLLFPETDERDYQFIFNKCHYYIIETMDVKEMTSFKEAISVYGYKVEYTSFDNVAVRKKEKALLLE